MPASASDELVIVDHEVHAEHLRDRGRADRSLRERDRGADQQHGDQRADLGGEQHRDPEPRVVRGRRAPARTGARRRSPAWRRGANWARLKTSLISGSRRSSGSVAKFPSSPPIRRLSGVGEDQPEYERDVAERERVGVCGGSGGGPRTAPRRRTPVPGPTTRGADRLNGCRPRAKLKKVASADGGEQQVEPPDRVDRLESDSQAGCAGRAQAPAGPAEQAPWLTMTAETWGHEHNRHPNALT